MTAGNWRGSHTHSVLQPLKSPWASPGASTFSFSPGAGCRRWTMRSDEAAIAVADPVPE